MKLPPDFDFRPHPDRMVFLSRVIDQSALDDLFPEILRIKSSGPISLYIDSPGGSPLHSNLLHRMLVAPNQDSVSRRRLLTVATGLAASAAADLLIAGDYTLAYEHATIMMHGVRQASDTDITTEAAANLARRLAIRNEQFALDLASHAVSTFFFRVAGAFGNFQQIRDSQSNSAMSDIDCFVAVTDEHVSSDIKKLLADAVLQCNELSSLDDSVRNALQPIFAANAKLPRNAEIEAAIIRAILDYELGSHPETSWSFWEQGIEALQNKAQLLFDRSADRHDKQVETLKARWGGFFRTPEDLRNLNSESGTDLEQRLNDGAEPRIRQFWFLLVAICRGLQTADFYLSAEEAYWLGFVDEIIGRPDLPNPRLFAEYLPDEGSETEKQ